MGIAGVSSDCRAASGNELMSATSSLYSTPSGSINDPLQRRGLTAIHKVSDTSIPSCVTWISSYSLVVEKMKVDHMFELLPLLVVVLLAWFFFRRWRGASNTEKGGTDLGSATRQDSATPLTQSQMRQRYNDAMLLWESGDAEKIRTAIPIFNHLVDVGADFPGPYVKAFNILTGLDANKFSKEIVDVLRKARHKFPDDPEFTEDLEIALFSHGKASWDREDEVTAFDSYLEGLHSWSDRGNTVNQDSPVHVRIGFLAARMFSKAAMNNGNEKMAIRFSDYCEKNHIDMNLDLDVSDASG